MEMCRGIKTTADSYIFVPGNAVVREQEDDTTRWFMQNDGSARLFRGAGATNKYVIIPITLPGVQYGQPVTVKAGSLTVTESSATSPVFSTCRR